MIGLLENILKYKRIIIVTDDYSSNMSKLVFNAITNAINKKSGEYKFTDLYGKGLSKYVLKKYTDGYYGSYLLRLKGSGYNFHNMGLQESTQTVRNTDLIITVRRNKCVILSDVYEQRNYDDKIELDVKPLYKSYKLSKILKRINGNGIRKSNTDFIIRLS